MEKKVFTILFLYFCVFAHHQIQSMKSNVASELTFNRVWQQIKGGEIQKKEVKRFLESNVLSISYSDAQTQKKVELLNNFFMQAFNADAINNPFKKQFCGIGFTFHDNEQRNIIISNELQFASAMEFAVKAGSDELLEQALKTAIHSQHIKNRQIKINRALDTAILYSCGRVAERCEIFKKYNIPFTIRVEKNKTLLHQYMRLPHIAVWLLENTDIDVNQQDDYGNIVAHYLALTSVGSRDLLVRILNAFIKKNINIKIRNKKGETAKETALTRCPHKKACSCANNANIFNRFEMGFNLGEIFVLADDGETIITKKLNTDL